MTTTEPSLAPAELAPNWPVPGEVPLLSTPEVHVWSASLLAPPAVLEHYRGLLSPDEHARAARFRCHARAAQFIAARGLLRTLLGQYADASPARLRFTLGPAGKPALLGEPNLHFNLSHSGALALLAFARSPVGADLEELRPIPERDAIAATFFAPGECARLARLPEPHRDPAFFRCWTRKEAWLKLTGDGITTRLKSFEVTFEPDAPPLLLWTDEASPKPGAIHHLDPAPGFIGALCSSEPRPRLRRFHFEHALEKA